MAAGFSPSGSKVQAAESRGQVYGPRTQRRGRWGDREGRKGNAVWGCVWWGRVVREARAAILRGGHS